jgi:hypothetical protein
MLLACFKEAPALANMEIESDVGTVITLSDWDVFPEALSSDVDLLLSGKFIAGAAMDILDRLLGV